jgi:hypothetical protein
VCVSPREECVKQDLFLPRNITSCGDDGETSFQVVIRGQHNIDSRLFQIARTKKKVPIKLNKSSGKKASNPFGNRG